MKPTSEEARNEGLHAAAPWVSAPTSDRVDDTVTVSGGGMAPGAQLLLSLMNGQGQPAGDFDAEANASGNFSVNIPLSGEGGYLLEVRVVGDASDVPAAFMHLVPGTSQ